MSDTLTRRTLLLGGATAASGAWLWGSTDPLPADGTTASAAPAPVCRFPEDAPHLMGSFVLETREVTPDSRLDGELLFANAGGAPATLNRELVRYRRDDRREARTIADLSETIPAGEQHRLALSLATPTEPGTWVYDAGSAWALGSCDLTVPLWREVTVVDD
jgi:hypothetical protein